MAEDKEIERMQEDLEDLETYLREYNAFLPLAVCTVNPVGILIDVNSAFEKMTGYSAIEGTGEKVTRFFKESEKIDSFLSHLKEGDSFAESVEAVLVKKEGKEIIVSVTASTRSDREGNFIGFFLGINNITELKRLQNELEEKVNERTQDLEERTKELERSQREIMEAFAVVEEERNKTSSLVTNLTDGLIYTDKDGNIEMLNPQAKAMLKLHNEDVEGTNISEPTDSERFEKLRSMISPENELDRETLNFSEDFIVEVTTVTVKNDKNKETGRLVILHDISKERALDNLKIEFISVATHQMRTPLSAIKWAFEILLSSDDEKMAPDLKKIAENGFESTQRILKIVNNFLDVDAMESLNVDYVFAPVSISKVIEKIFSEVSIQAREKSIELVYKNEGENLPYVQADQEQLTVVMQNLIENALKYTIEEGNITVKAEVKDNNMVVSVSDEGIGISESESENIFTKFFRAENAKRVETDGNGLGLHTAKRIVEKHGGTIWFESQMGKGTTFYFTIPLYNK
ncbi:MAG: ATP-binding protein [Candidatus Campbellbacteria bacterium]|nr:ATP-binding protein [Candidatus Campbellbacteria bacterium]